MKKIIIAYAALSICSPLIAQWTTNGSGDAYNNNSSGKVGIGTSTPGYTLDVYAPANNWKARFGGPDGYITIGPANSGTAHIYTDRSSFIFNQPIWSYVGIFSSYNTSDMTLQTNGTTRMTIANSNGYVGIGATTPGSKFHVVDGGQAVKLLTGTNSSGYALSVGVNDDGVNFSNNSTIRGYNFSNATGNLMTLTSNGSVGIGTTFPADQFEIVSGNRKVGLNAIISGVSNGGVIAISRPDDGLKTMYIGSTAAPADDNVIFSQGGNTELRFVSNGGPYATAGFGFYNNITAQSAFGSLRPTPVMKIDGNGNVGIGSTAPDAKLAVNGTVHAKEVKVDLNVPGPDYVFEKNYALTSLEEIKTYIEKNKHLPEVPSAKEMETNGINLSEMNMLLLKKIEELTLYVIEQQKEIKELKKSINK